ncbi:protein odr-4 homolog [Mizuhopecten yessoensis]|uniref:Protein odr-4-like n=1 Tax=Mizuhopecten yessoensis TaxID=6573 RepID=A0A210PWZ5_MIZYE|nr:protein odr-4 homolog [Mizuhopecten yessoensis]OWF41028.1 Protein odr-4-like [Mizuhopecten yessoensis]
MGRTVLADETIQDYVEKLIKNGSWNLGLIIGQLTAQKDYAVRLIRTPEPVEDEVSEEEEDSDATKKRKRSDNRPESLCDVSEKWAATHAKQAIRMLPGGIDVIGVFALAPPNMMQASQAKLRQIVFAIHKTLVRGQLVSEEGAITDRILLQICSTTRKYTCRSIDVGDAKSSFRPADWKSHSGGDHWIRLQSDIAVDLRIPVPVRSQNLTFLKQLQSGVTPYCQRLCGGIALFNGKMREPTETLDQSESKGRSKGRDKGQTTQQVQEIEFCMKAKADGITETRVSENVAKMAVRGCIHSRAYVYGKAEVRDGIKALQTDVVRSLMARCELLYEDVIDVVEEESVLKELYNTPVRVFGKLPGTHLDFCDYMFPDEKMEEVTDRIEELLDISITEDKLDLTCERMATEEDMETTEKDDSQVNNQVVRESNLGFNIGTILGGVVAAALAGFSYYILGET